MKCLECRDSGKLFKIKEQYRSFCGTPQYNYDVEPWMTEPIPCPFCNGSDVYIINDLEV